MKAIVGSRARATAGMRASLVVAAVVTIAACGDQSAPATGVISTAPSQPTAPSAPPNVQLRGSAFVSTPWWAGSAYPIPPLVEVVVNFEAASNVTVRWSATNGGTVGTEAVTSTDAQGKSVCPPWILGRAGVDSVTASVDPVPGRTDTLRASFSVTALAQPAQFAEYRLLLVNGVSPPTPNQVEQDIVGGLLRLGSDGTLEWIEYDGGFGSQYPVWGTGRFAVSQGAIAFSPTAGADSSRFPGATATVVGDTLTTSFMKVIEVGLDSETVLRTETFVRASGPPVGELSAPSGFARRR